MAFGIVQVVETFKLKKLTQKKIKMLSETITPQYLNGN